MKERDSLVFVTQIPNKRDHATRKYIPSVDITHAAEFGEVVVLFPSNANFHSTNLCIDQLQKDLAEFNPECGDCLVALGDPVLIAAAGAILGREHGAFTLLKWDKFAKKYVPVKISV